MWPDRVSNPGPRTYESGALPIALRGPREKTKWHNPATIYPSVYPGYHLNGLP